MNPETGLATVEKHGLEIPNYEVAIRSLQQRRDLVMQLMDTVLKDGIHYGKIPGCGDKPSLFLAGAEQLAASFQLCPRYKVTRTRDGMHLTIDIVCELYSPSGAFIGEGVATCSTYESKYRYRNAQQVGECTGNPVPKAFWDLRKKDAAKAQALIGGRGYTYKKDENNVWMIYKVAEQSERVENTDLADCWNTVLKMGAKRAFVHAVRTSTGTADIYTQDLEDFRGSYGAVLDAEVVVYPEEVPGFDPSAHGGAPEPEKKPEPKPEPKPEKKPEPKPEKKAEPKPSPAPEENRRPAPENRPKPEDVKKNAEEFVNGVTPNVDPYGVEIPALDAPEFKEYSSLRLGNACQKFALHYIKLVTGDTVEERNKKAVDQAKTMRDNILRDMNKTGAFTNDESAELKKVMLAERMEKKFKELGL